MAPPITTKISARMECVEGHLSSVKVTSTHARYYYESAAGKPVAFDTRQMFVNFVKLSAVAPPAALEVPAGCHPKISALVKRHVRVRVHSRVNCAPEQVSA